MNFLASSVSASAVIPKYLTSAQAAPFLLFGPLKLVMKPVLEANSGDVGSLLIVGGAESLYPANSSIINGDQIIIGVFPAKYKALDCFQNNSPGGLALAITL